MGTIIKHTHLIGAIEKALVQILVARKSASVTVEKLFKANRKWGARDRRQVAAVIYDVVRWLERLKYATGHARPSEENISDLVALWLQLEADEKNAQTSMYDNASEMNIIHALPKWLTDEIETLPDFELILLTLNKPAKVFLRTNTNKTSTIALLEQLTVEGLELEVIDSSSDSLVMVERKNVGGLKSFKAGLFEMQDLGSQEISKFANPRPGDTVIDACAGAGGKTLHLACLMEDKGKVLALDIAKNKLEQLQKRVKRTGLSCIEARPISSSKVIKRQKGRADLVLLDVPCTGTGVIRRRPDYKWRWNPSEVAELNETQYEILNSYSQMAKSDGRVIYATCSLLKSENQDVVSRFLTENPEWSLTRENQVLGHQLNCDYFYMAELSRNTNLQAPKIEN